MLTFAFGLALAGISPRALAAASTWDGALSGTWDTATANWSGATFTTGNDALFTGTPTSNVTLAAGLTIGAITLDNTFSGSVAMTGANTVSGPTTLSGGTLILSHATGLGTSAVTVNSGGTLALNASTAADITYANSVSGGGKVQFLYNVTGAHDIFLNNLGSFTGTIQLSLAPGSASTGGKARLGSGNATLSGTASLIIDSGTQLHMGNGNATFGTIQVSGTGNTENRGAIRAQTGILTGALSLLGNTTIGTEGGTISGSISSGASGTQTLTLGTTNSTGNLTLNSSIGGGTGTIALLKTQNGTTTLNGANSYTGGTTLSAGILSVGTNSALGTGSVTFSGGTLANATNVTLSNNLSTTSGVATITAPGGTMVLNGNVTGANGLTLTPTNKITLAGTNSVATVASFGNLTVNAGAGGVDLTGSTTVGSGNNANSGGYLSIGGTVTVTLPAGGALSILGTTNATAPGSIVGQNAAGTSTLSVNGGSLTIGPNTGIGFGNNVSSATGVLTVSSGTVTINRGSTTATDPRSFVALGRDTATGIVNLNGGVLATDRNFVRDGSVGADVSGAANFNFGGGKLKALTNQPDWLNSSTKNTNQLALSSVTTSSAASTIDPNGFAVGLNNAISGAGGFNINSSTGTGTVTLGGSNSYVGATTVTAGTLIVSGSISGSTATVNNSGSILGGTGTVGNVTVNGGAILQGGDGSSASGALSSGGDVSLNDGAIIKLTLGAAATHSSLLRSAGTWSFDLNQGFTFNAGAATGSYDNIISGLTGAESGLATISTWLVTNPEYAGSTFTYDSAGGVDLVLIPEPGTAASLWAGLTALLGLPRLRRRRA